MAYRMYGALIASLSVAALMLAGDETFARSATARRAAFASTHLSFHPPIAHSLRHHRRSNLGIFLPAIGGFSGPSNSEPILDGTQPISSIVNLPYTHDAH